MSCAAPGPALALDATGAKSVELDTVCGDRSSQWRREGLQRPGANACIGAPPPPGEKIDKQKEKKEKKGRQQEKEKKDPHRERGALESAGSIAYMLLLLLG